MSITLPPPGWDLPDPPFHDGELAIQERLGVREKLEPQGRRAIRRYIPQQHRDFYPLLPYVFIGSVDAEGQPWASMLTGDPGFLSTPDEHILRIQALPQAPDRLATTLHEGAEIAALGVDFTTRRRNRVIGQVAQLATDGFDIRVRHTLGVCPQYIQIRAAERHGVSHPAPVAHRSPTLDDAAMSIIANADTYFVASHDPRSQNVNAGADISHRGGRPGFVRIDDEASVTAPEFVGNFIFNTLGNFSVDPRAGLLFVDFDRGQTLHLTAVAEVIWDGPDIAAFAGAQRLVRYRITSVTRIENALPYRFSPPEYSPLLARTGTWSEAEASLRADALRQQWRPYLVAGRVEETSEISSFMLEPADGLGVAGFQPGQFLPIRAGTAPGQDALIRTYTLSDAPNGRSYRISVKREGRGGMSDWLFDTVRPGQIIEALAPRGGFTFQSDPRRSVVLIAAGIGITPMMAMLGSLLVNDGRTRHHGPITLIQGARNGASHAFGTQLREKARLHSNFRLHVRYSQPSEQDSLGKTHDSIGHVDLTLLRQILPFDDHEFYLCGPAAFMQSLYTGLRGIGVRDARIHFESFGPASVRRVPDSTPADTSEAIEVTFTRSGKTALWRPDAGSLLDLAEQQGIPAISSCRSGICGTCAVRVSKGRVDYTEQPSHDIEPGEALICCARPHPGPHLNDGTTNREGVDLDL